MTPPETPLNSDDEQSTLIATRRQVLLTSAALAAYTALRPYDASAESAAADALATPTEIGLEINGRAYQVEIDPRQSILDLLRENLELTGTKKGCNQGACGACTVMIDGKRVNSCLTLAVMHQGSHITTIEGLADGETLHPLQAAFVEHEGFQCGYCTSGQIMSGLGCIAEGHAHSEEEIAIWMSGNICRCGAYPGIRAAVAQAAEAI